MRIPFDTCWRWVGAVNKRGYGVFQIGLADGTILAHRMAWMLARATDPTGMQVNHTCDQPDCVNPDHLYLGSQKDNLRDMSTRLRNRIGEAHGCARLTDAQVLDLRRRRTQGEGIRALGRAFGISYGSAWRLVRMIDRPRDRSGGVLSPV